MALARVRFTLAAICMTVLAASSASAQVFGTFSWQMQPFCNVVTMTITQVPSGFTVDGFDEQCGAVKRASSVGMALINPDGTVGINFTIVTVPGGKGVHVAAVIGPVTGSGTWIDSVGNSGTFVLASAVPGLPARPRPASGVGPATITAVEIAAAAVGAAQLATNAVTGANVVNGTLTAADLADGPRGNFVGGTQSLFLTSSDVVVRSLTLTVPASGRVIVSASGSFFFFDASATNEVARCAITTATAIDAGNRFVGQDGGATGTVAMPFGATRGFAVGPGAFTVNLVCDESAGFVTVQDTNLTAVFVAQ